jgi:hypothetical protein
MTALCDCHCVQAVLKRKTEEAEAARRKLRELTELQARVRRDKQAMHAATAGDGSGALGWVLSHALAMLQAMLSCPF